MMLRPTLAIGLIPPQAALVLTIFLIIFLFRRDIQQRSNITGAVWLPLLWMLIICTRQPSEWMSLFGFRLGGVSLEGGSPFDACIYFLLIAAGLWLLHKRGVQLCEIVRNNQWLTIFFVYCFLAIFWSDYPFVSFKRWIKVIGHPLMALIILTESDPIEALTTLMKRCAYIVIPISVTFIRYFPEWGRGFEPWSGAATNVGIAGNKNALGCDCLILGFFFFWYFLQVRQMKRGKPRRRELILVAFFLVAICWLLSMAHSSTSSVSLVLAMLVVWVLGSKSVNKQFIGTYVIIGLAIIVVADSLLGLHEYGLQFLHKDSTLTDRTLLWSELLRFNINPVVGTGFESFWLGDRRELLWAKLWWHPNEAHNGYLETYLNLGLIGLCLLLAMLFAAYRNARFELLFSDGEFGRFRLGLLAAVVAYNWTEAAFKNISPLWFIFYFVALDYRVAFSGWSEDGVVSDSAYIDGQELVDVDEERP